MKKTILTLCFLLCCAGPAMADALDTFLGNINVQAAGDRHGAVASIGSHFGVPYSDVELLMGTTGSLADAFMVLQIGRWTGLSRDRIMGVYGSRKGQGWGAMAKELGIKPGSAEFHALKNGDFGYDPRRPYRGDDKGGASNKGGYSDNGPGKGGKPDKGENFDNGGGKGKKK
jgi:hypothetical protein